MKTYQNGELPQLRPAPSRTKHDDVRATSAPSHALAAKTQQVGIGPKPMPLLNAGVVTLSAQSIVCLNLLFECRRRFDIVSSFLLCSKFSIFYTKSKLQ